MTPGEVIAKVKEKGFWNINIRPTVFDKNRIKNRKEAITIIRESVVELRGWDYPHFSDRDGDPHSIQDGIEKQIAWENHIEIWRMYLSAQFVHLLALREDWLSPEQKLKTAFAQEREVKSVLGVTGTLFTLTEIFEFTRRLSQKGIFGEEVLFDITLNNINERGLLVDSPGRLPFLTPKISEVDKWSFNKVISTNEILKNSKEISFNATLDLFELFNWLEPPVQTIKEDQNRFLEGKY